MPSVSVIIPTRNERDNIPKLVQEFWNLQDMGYDYQLVLVDDSIDDTPDIARDMKVRVIEGRHLGLAQAVLDGIDRTDTEYIIVMDADLQHPPSLLPEVVGKLRFHDMVLVTKHTKEAMAELSQWRKLQSNLGLWLSKTLVRAPISDTMTGFFGIRRKCLEGIPRGEYTLLDDRNNGHKPENWDTLNDEKQSQWYEQMGLLKHMYGIEAIGFKIGLELFAKAHWVTHVEIPMTFMQRELGQSKGTAHSLHKHLWRLFKNSLEYEVELPDGAQEYYAFYEGGDMQRAWKQQIAHRLQDITKEIQPEKLLDVGCGSSPNINFMVAKNRVGVDIRTKALDYMRGHSSAIFIEGSILTLPFEDNSFDCISCIEVLEHLYVNQIEVAMQELVRVLQPEGYLILATPNYDSWLWRIIEFSQHYLQPGEWTGDHHTQFNRRLLQAMCSDYGLEEIRYDSIMANMDMISTFQQR